MNFCLFCQTENRIIADHIDFVCASCITILSRIKAEELKKAYDKALTEGYGDKARALRIFIAKEEKSGRPANKKGRDFEGGSVRRGTAGTVRDFLQSTEESKREMKIAVSATEQNTASVLGIRRRRLA